MDCLLVEMLRPPESMECKIKKVFVHCGCDYSTQEAISTSLNGYVGVEYITIKY